jgi:hypothetical protein
MILTRRGMMTDPLPIWVHVQYWPIAGQAIHSWQPFWSLDKAIAYFEDPEHARARHCWLYRPDGAIIRESHAINQAQMG